MMKAAIVQTTLKDLDEPIRYIQVEKMDLDQPPDGVLSVSLEDSRPMILNIKGYITEAVTLFGYNHLPEVKAMVLSNEFHLTGLFFARDGVIEFDIPVWATSRELGRSEELEDVMKALSQDLSPNQTILVVFSD